MRPGPPSPSSSLLAGHGGWFCILLLGLAASALPGCDGGSVGIEVGFPPAVEVRVAPAGVTVSGVGETQAFGVDARDAQGRRIPEPAVLWSSRNRRVATVDHAGVATAVMSGQATISAEVDGVVGSALLTVTVPDTDPVASWDVLLKGTALEDVWGASPADVFAVGTGGTILHFDGSRWETMETGTESHIAALWATSSTDVYAVGDAGTIVHYDGTAWSTLVSPTGMELRGVWTTSQGDVEVVGLYGVILEEGR